MGIKFKIIAAMDIERGIGKNGRIPWKLNGDMRGFKERTTWTLNPEKSNLVVMGRKTWESLPNKFRPLPNRINVVLTRNNKYKLPKNVIRINNFNELENYVNKQKNKIETVYIIGGSEIYSQAIKLNLISEIFLTKIMKDFNCDTFFPKINKDFKEDFRLSNLENGITYYITYMRKINE